MKTDVFFEQMSQSGLGLTFDDLRLKTGHSEVPPDKVELTSYFSQKIKLNFPLISAAMDTVTEKDMAIAMADCGGLGIIHRNMTPGDQAYQVSKVKHYRNVLIRKPITISLDDTIEKVLSMTERREFKFRSFPVINTDGQLIGVVTGRDFEFCNQPKDKIQNIMTKDVFTGSIETTPEEAEEIMRTKHVKILPIVTNNNVLTGLYLWSDVTRLSQQSLRHSTTDSSGRLQVGAAIGTGRKEIIRAEELIDKEVDVLVIDTAHGDSDPVYETLVEIKKNWPEIEVVIGNVTEGDSALRLFKAGANGIKVGQGPGSICTTRIIAGVGCPQATAIYNCVTALKGTNIPICADGGIKNSGDITIALAIGAESVMVGRMIAGTDEAPGDITIIDGVPCKHYRGMGSLSAMKESSSSRSRYRQSDKGKLTPEGIEGAVPIQGPVAERLNLCIGGIRAGLGYVGAASLPELREKAQFYRLTSASQTESHPHDVHIIAEAPNYSAR